MVDRAGWPEVLSGQCLPLDTGAKDVENSGKDFLEVDISRSAEVALSRIIGQRISHSESGSSHERRALLLSVFIDLNTPEKWNS